MKKILFITLVLVFIAMGVFYWVLINTKTDEINQFNTAPTSTETDNQNSESNNIDSNATMTDEKSGIFFSYPTTLDSNYVSTEEWPPRFISSYAPIDCELDEQTQAMSGLSYSTETINGTSYCIWQRNEGAAGSTYTNYQVSYEKDNQYITMSFTLKYPQCDNYSEEERQVCMTKQNNFPLYKLIDEIAKSSSLPSY